MTRPRASGCGRAGRRRPSSAGEAPLRRASSVGWRPLATTGVLVMAGGSRLFACPVCFGAEETSLIDGTKLGILALLAVTLVVQGAFAGFFLYLRRRARRIADGDLDREWSQLQGASRTP